VPTKGEHGAVGQPEGGRHGQEGDGGQDDVGLEGGDHGAGRDHAQGPLEHRDAGDPVGQRTPDGAGQGGQDHEPGRPGGRVGGVQAVDGLEEGGQVDAEGHEATEGDGVHHGQVAGDGQAGRGQEPGHEGLGGPGAVGGVAPEDQEGDAHHGQPDGHDQERPGPAEGVGHPGADEPGDGGADVAHARDR
jgi:hypothetical protein